jgi:amino-acid N-acetyltransferase
MHNIGTRARCQPTRENFYHWPPGLAAAVSPVAAIVDGAMAYTIRSARTRDVPVIRKLIDSNVESGRLLSKATVTLYEDIQEFCVAELYDDAALAGCGALHVMWEDLAEIRTVAVREDCQRLGIGHGIVDTLLARARVLGVDRVFVLTFAVGFFARHGFQPISDTPVAAEVYRELLRSYDEGVAEFLDLERVKPNTLGNTRMLLRLLADRRKKSMGVARETIRAQREYRARRAGGRTLPCGKTSRR